MRMTGRAVPIAACLIVLAGCSHQAKTGQPPAPQRMAATSHKAATPAPTASPSPVATAAPPAPPGKRVVFSPPPAQKRVPRVASDAAPQILDVAVSETRVQPGDRVFGSVLTTSNVASVEARIGGYAVALTKVGVGRFALHYTVGPLPWFVRGSFTMQVIARNTRGDAAVRAIPLTVR
jgi:hypothetical protein